VGSALFGAAEEAMGRGTAGVPGVAGVAGVPGVLSLPASVFGFGNSYAACETRCIRGVNLCKKLLKSVTFLDSICRSKLEYVILLFQSEPWG
jgi:hypothetical protein